MMTFEQALAVQDYLHGHNIEVEVRGEYSGRGMFGETGPAFVCPSRSWLLAIGWAFGQLSYRLDSMPSRTEDMGRGVVVY